MTRTSRSTAPGAEVWKQLRRDGIRVARCTVARLMRAMGLAGAVRGRAWITTTHAGEGGRPVDLVDRQFVATRPNQLWVSDFTYVATWSGFVYVRVRHRRVCATHCGLAGVGLHAHGLRAGFNLRRLLGPIGDIPPAEFEAQYYQQAEVA